MGEYAEERLSYLHPEVFGGRGRTRIHSGNRHVYLPVEKLGVFVVKGQRFTAYSNGVIYAGSTKEEKNKITRTRGSRSFMRDYPQELVESNTLTLDEAKAKAKFWLEWNTAEDGGIAYSERTREAGRQKRLKELRRSVREAR